MDIEKHYWSFYSISKWNHSHELGEFYTNFHSCILEQEMFSIYFMFVLDSIYCKSGINKGLENMWFYPDSHPVGRYWGFS